MRAYWIEPTKMLIHMEKLTVLIPFLNEKEEVCHTVANIRATSGNEVDIMLVDDASYDGYDYRQVARQFHATYIKQEKRCGIAQSRDYAIEACDTEFFLLLDGHMRFAESGWSHILLKAMKENRRTLFCCRTCPILKDAEGNITWVRHKASYGAYIDFEHLRWDLHWNHWDPAPDRPVIDIPVVLGGAYACNKTYWKYLNGLKGLQVYGLDEQYISMKAWLEGGACQLLKTVETGHLYRTRFPYPVEEWYMVYNKLLLTELLLTPEWKEPFLDKIVEEHSLFNFKRAGNTLLKKKEMIEAYTGYYDRIFTRPIESFIQRNSNFLVHNSVNGKSSTGDRKE